MRGRRLELGEHSDIEATPQRRDERGKWKTVQHHRQAERWRARCRYRGFDGRLVEISRIGRDKRNAVRAVEAALEQERRGVSDVELKPSTMLITAGELWLAHIRRSDSGLSRRTVDDYSRTFRRYIDADGSTIRGLTLEQANNPQRLRKFLQTVADKHGSGAAKISKSVLSGVFGFAVNDGVLASNALREVRPVKAQTDKRAKTKRAAERDTTRSFTVAERQAVMDYADELARDENVRPQTRRKRQATADLVAFLAGTGVRITEARMLRWQHVNLDAETVDIYGTKSETSERRLSLPSWLAERLRERSKDAPSEGYVFASPHGVDPEAAAERVWDQSNAAKAVASVLDGAGMSWAVPHTFRRTVATVLHEGGVPLVKIADQLGHTDPAMTARVYLGRDFGGDKSALAALL